ncbi:hypothetical protein FFWV33_15775 [Flavobacterium faecale]|uniref:Uncharacterized protein n=2 Tax=Flavobacterium faecale TaxID=1355330 RepID=A0A2S1LGP2_9FLAO|nr:hypothetical protein FFWV33_15775 [Flavobacterium faecale]
MVFLVPICFISCNSDVEDSITQVQPSISLILMEGEGGSVEVSFTNGDWNITGVNNSDGDVKISGNSYSIDNKLVIENYMLSLEGLGRIEAFGGSKGFVISRNTPTSLNVKLNENSSGEDFNFTVDLQSANESKKITVKQMKSQGYNFKSIEYILKQNDGDSLFIRNGEGYKFSVSSPQEFSFSPFTGVEINRKTYFTSDEKDAFVWLKNNSIKVEVPSSIDNKYIHTDNEEVYTDLTTISNYELDQKDIVKISSGESEFYTEIQFRKRTVSYILYLTNKRTGGEKKIEGKWVEIAPTGDYDIIWKN